MMCQNEESAAALYLARGADTECDAKFDRFIQSYQLNAAGIAHTLYVALKGFASPDHLAATRARFSAINPVFLNLEDNRYDVGAYIDCSKQMAATYICFMNTHAEILAPNWLNNFVAHLRRREVGLVGASGSFESLQLPGLEVELFPNPHLRTNGFALRRTVLLDLFRDYLIGSKLDAYAFESGRSSLTRRITARGYDVLVVGRNGRGYPPLWWPASDTFRQGRQDNLLIADNQTRRFDDALAPEKSMLLRLAWGSHIELADTRPDLDACSLR
ncbi:MULTISPECIES: hypothetical protein [unclassified Methylobacterium]|uniref:hypothetical protein n=1 Tax=unclassified Methylobacterium TaxID=2615210 RepID=UPI0011C1F4FB|nr:MULTISPECIES: hypothetical protein [unclassified Methylobacterium]QEE39055.1 hypothetical protein FVA80_08945 [Methylobacterium sp. WL1]TXN56738.1 hypothetical protein FV241_14295 [Methylobacterium sp. WL2]